jgi:transcriptional regulator
VLTDDTKKTVSIGDTMTRSTVPDLLPGTLGLLILRTLQREPLHGWAISERVQQISEDVLQINQGSLYPALHRLEHQGWIEAEWAVSELGRRAKYYRLTPSGRRQLAVETREWERMSAAIGRVIRLA